MRILILTFGTRGDVQPYVALARELLRAGHQVVVSTAEGFRDLVTGYGVEFLPSSSRLLELIQDSMPAMRGPGDIARIMTEMREAMRISFDEHWAAAEATEPDLIIYHPKTLAGPHIAERMGIPGLLSLPLPFYTPTRDFPIPFIGSWPLGGRANRLSYLFPRLANVLYRNMINNFRRRIDLSPIGWLADPLRTADGSVVPVLYPYSRHVVPIPNDYPPTAHVTGYWFLPADQQWQPDPALVDFLESGPPPVYVGFGSMGFGKGSDQRAEAVRLALKENRVRGVLATGWGGLAAGDSTDDLLVVDAVPHDWLFPRVSAVVHHGGAGTTAAGLAAGRPTLIVPFLGDQGFWGHQVHKIGAGPEPLPHKKITVAALTERIGELITSDDYRRRAAEIGTLINSENGPRTAVEIIEDLDLGRPASASTSPGRG